jgi:hypothetical protein
MAVDSLEVAERTWRSFMRTRPSQMLSSVLAGYRAVLCALALSFTQVAIAQESAAPVQAIWKIHELDFAYMGITTYYSCDGLVDRTKAILLQMGARADVSVRSGACDQFTGPARMPSVRILVALPVEATDESIAALKTDSRQAQLLAKLRKANKRGPTFSDAPFFAMPKRVVISHKDKSTHGAAAGDCELLEQLARDALPKFGIKVVRKDLGCMPHSPTLSAQLEVESLMAVEKGS